MDVYYLSKYEDEDLDDIEGDSILKKQAIKSLDTDLAQYFDEDGLDDFNDVSNTSIRSKRGNKNLKIIYELGDNVMVEEVLGRIIFGPYELNKLNYYEIESEKGKIFNSVDKNIKKI